MTCIIGTRDYICGDRRINCESGASAPPHRKVFANAHMIVGLAGDLRGIVKVEAAMREGADRPQALEEALKDDTEALVLQGRLYHVGEGYTVAVPRRFFAIGSGADLALGYLAGLGCYTAEAAREAQRYVARERDDCGGRVDLLAPA